MITEFFDCMLSQESFFSQSFVSSSYSCCLTQALSTLVFLLEGIVCLDAYLLNRFGQNPQLLPPAISELG